MHSPVGVVVIPSSHNVYATGEGAIISCLSVNFSNSEQSMAWSNSNTNAGLTKYTSVNVVSDATSNTLSGVQDSPRLPSTNTNGRFTVLSADGISMYNDATPYAPSPYLEDGSRNPIYHSTEKSTYNALSDFNGVNNTKVLSSQESSAAYACSQFEADGIQQGQWYLPSCGELGYMIARFDEIQQALKAIKEVYGELYAALLMPSTGYWSSTEYSTTHARPLGTNVGIVSVDRKTETGYYVRPYARIRF